MNHKLLKASLAGAAVIALAAGGGTYAAWSDFNTVAGNETDGGHLVLNLPGSTGPISNVHQNAIAPGQFRTIDYFLTSADLDGVPSAALSMQVKNLKDIEDGCQGNSEVVVDSDCADTSQPGEFSSQAYMRVRYSDPTTAATAWNSALHECTVPVTHGVGVTEPDNDTTHYPRLAAYATSPTALGTVTAGQGVCVRIDIGLDPNATNAVQGDSSTFDLEFDLNQI